MKLVMTDGSYFEGTVEEMIAIRKAFSTTPEHTPEHIPDHVFKEVPIEIGDIVVITGNNSGSVNGVGDIGRVVDANHNDKDSVSVLVPGRPSSSNYTAFSDMRLAKDYEREIYHLRMEDY